MGKKILNFLRKPYLFIIFLALGIILYTVSALSGVCVYKPSGGIATSSRLGTGDIKFFDVSPNGNIAMNIKTNRMTGAICSANLSSGKADLMVGDNLLKKYCRASSRFDVVMGENGDIWLHYVTWSENSAAVESEGILRIGSDGKSVALTGGIDYAGNDDPPTREPRLGAFYHTGEALTFAYSDMKKAAFYAIDDKNGTQTLTGEYIPDEDVFIAKVLPISDGFLLVLSNSSILRTGYDGKTTEMIYSSKAAMTTNADIVDTICCAAESDGKLYVSAGVTSETLFMLEDDALVPVAEIPIEEYSSPKVSQLDAADGKIYIGLSGHILVYDGSAVTELDTSFRMPFSNAMMSLFPFISLILAGIGILFFIVFIILIKKSLLLKQLLFMVPAIVVVCLLICRQAGANILSIYMEQQAHANTAICDVCASHIDGDSIGEMLDSGVWSTQQYVDMRNELLDTLHYNRGYWNYIYDMRLIVPHESGFTLIFADSAKISVPFSEIDIYVYIPTLEGLVTDKISGISAYNVHGSTADMTSLITGMNIDAVIAVAPVCDSEGNLRAYLVTSTDDFTMRGIEEAVIWILLQTMIPYMIILVIITALICTAILLRIRKATKTVKKIAEGDLTARIKNRSNDELGEICQQVNTMASNLEVIFDEKDKNEQFYYKFVPEKFRELLGKDKITDLSLGDAESREFSVLFCDIRSFSINSEMLTAKENFEFVNVIFGIAGPIIREYGGFVDKYIGDAVMALFETPDDAVEAGIKIYRSIVLDPSVAERLNVRDINIGVGIHTGIARIGIVGEEERLSGTVISDTVNLSSRLESLTKKYHTAMIVSKDTIDRMKDPDSLNKRYIGMVQVAGVNDVTALYEVLECLGDEEKEKRTATKDDFKEAVRLFHLGRREESVELLKKIQASGKADHVVDMYCEYIEHLSGEDKGNVFRFVRK